jgi:hypothetical protein
MVLEGSLNQLLITFIAFVAFYYKIDQACATFALLWFCDNFIDVSIFMADGCFWKLSLILGTGMEGDDWRNLFNYFDLWGNNQMLSSMVFYLGWAGLFLVWV